MKRRTPEDIDPLLQLRDAANRMGISYPTLKQWIYKKRIRTVKTAGGHYRIPHAEVERFSQPEKKTNARSGSETSRSSVRNKLLGTITRVQVEGLLAQITLDVGGQTVTSIITRDACEDLGLKRGMAAFAMVKATEVSVSRA